MDFSSRKRKIADLIDPINDYEPKKKLKIDKNQQTSKAKQKTDLHPLHIYSNQIKIQPSYGQSQQIPKFHQFIQKEFESPDQSYYSSKSKSKQKKQQIKTTHTPSKYQKNSFQKHDDPLKNSIQTTKVNKRKKINLTTLQESDFKQKQKIKHKKQLVTTESTPLKINDPPSHNKNNIVVTRGVDFVPVDNYFTRRQQAKVLEFHKAFYSITLSQSNLAKDDNKFFIIQLLVIGEPSQEEYYLFSRWGRVGVIGQISQNGPLKRKEAIRQYNVKSQAKVNHGGYRIVEMSYEYDQEMQDKQLIEIDQYLTKENSKLPSKVQQLMKLIFDIKMMQTHMSEIGYDQKRSPLGLIARSAIEKGYIALDNILKVLKSNQSESQKRNKLNQYSSQFYSAIPHDFGYLNMRAFVLNNEEKVKQKLEMLASLSQIQIYSNLMKQKPIDDHLPDIDIKYSKLKCEITPLGKDTPIYSILHKYLKNTHAKTHDKYTMELAEIFTLKRPNQADKFLGNIGNKVLLWHGSRLTNYVGILSQGLKIAPYEAPSTGYMFGKGIYFADIASKSANYCLPKHNSSGLLLLCEVALGEMNDKFAADYAAHNLPGGKHSTRGVGKFAPSSGQIVDDVFIPNGQLKPTGIEQTSLLYNEYVVYNRQQIQCRYIVQVNFILKK